MNESKRLVLLGGNSRRSAFFLKAAGDMGVEARSFSYQDYVGAAQPGDYLKLDPPPFQASDFAELMPFVRRYQQQLTALAALPQRHFLNHPRDVAAALDKRETRQRLDAAGIAIAPPLHGPLDNYDALLQAMREQKRYRVFIKPRYGAGAAGVIAFALSPQGGQQLYSSLYEQEGRFINTKRIHHSRDPERNRRLIDRVLAAEAVVERWLPKAKFQDLAFDLRIVWQFGRIVFMVARGSQGPITNLHLNDRALNISDIPLGDSLRTKLEEISGRTMACFPGLHYAGLDILIPLHGDDPRIIEVNAQGDLIYKDIFAENRIYREQVEWYRNAVDHRTDMEYE